MRKMCQPSAHCDKMRKFPEGLKHLWPKQQQRQQTGYCPNHFFLKFPSIISIPPCLVSPSISSLPSFSLSTSLCTSFSVATTLTVSLSFYLSFSMSLFYSIPFSLSLSLYRTSCLNPAPHKATPACNRFHQRFLLAKEEYMVIKGSATKHNGERLHPAADVEQGGKKEGMEGRG